MDLFELAAKGWWLGLAIAAPVGAMSVLCIRRTLLSGMAIGLATGFGIALADALYGAVAASGLVAVGGFMARHEVALKLVGAAVLLWLGLKAVTAGRRSVPVPADEGDGARRIRTGLAAAFGSGFALTLVNPTTILLFLTLFAGLGIVGSTTAAAPAPVRAAALTVGVGLGSASWWLILTSAVALIGRQLPGWAIRAIDIASGVVLAGFGLIMTWEAIEAG